MHLLPRAVPPRRAYLGRCWIAIILALVAAGAPLAAAPLRFSFGERGPGGGDGLTHVHPGDAYTDARGWGFEPLATSTSSSQPVYFSVRLPEGDYAVTLGLGDPAEPTTTTVKAELRRLMLLNVHTEPGQITTQTFLVNLRRPEIAGTGQRVRLKPRERSSEAWAWDDKLELEFNGARPGLRTLTIAPVPPGTPVLYLLGDSTVTDQPAAPWNSWGQMLTLFFKPTIVVSNQAESGETAASSLSAGRLEKVLSTMRPGDWLLIQFGHNDMKRGSPEKTRYKETLRRYIDEARARGGQPVLVTSMERRAGVNGPTLAGYPEAMRELAKDAKIPLLDLNRMSVQLYNRYPADQLPLLFARTGPRTHDGTHHSNYGSYEMARCIVQAIRDAGLPLAAYLKEDVSAFDPRHPDPIEAFHVPPSPTVDSTRPLGD